MCFPNIHKQGYPFIGIAFLLTCVGFAFSIGLGVVFQIITVMCVCFFRNPERVVPVDDGLVVSPADGVVTSIAEVESPVEDGKTVRRISIYLSVLDVHVNRIPVSGVVKSVEHRAGKFTPACTDGSVNENERTRSVIETTFGNHNVVVEQIAGLIARRVVCDVRAGDSVKLGSRMGIIRFGSRMNVYIPVDVPILISEGHTVVGGETIIADFDVNRVPGRHGMVFEKV
ncbi:phosphatidylserine decarboxylase [Candidatus Anaplasma sp. TIGMIC]|uniref:phosphatidylserine decarboxylase n=1 Tax=Candidatus Anaplasma sp. TIGMIC TaxID=3020713 RepID=UPI00232BE327|nr:phosphatidylserine decarboxylase [Candidatus Anaplasma sp. TIGMIC]MDB1135619.1 phosphatidylserine decarboxylase [Candidatus Anaplasma sp. TIGMIC]